MSNGTPPVYVPSPAEAYAALPYHFPIIDLQKVVRIPIVGPEPFNTLVVVRGQVVLTDYRWADGKLHRRKVVVGTNFRLIGFDPRVPAPFKHSTSAALQMIQSSDDTAFVSAIDEVDGFFDDQGNWMIVAHVADLWDQVYAASRANLSSWILCYEPPPPEGPGVISTLKQYAVPAPHWIIERESSASSDTDKQFQRFLKINQRRKARELERCGVKKSASRSSRRAVTMSALIDESVPVAFPHQTLSDEESMRVKILDA
jgi:hypothetical protein